LSSREVKSTGEKFRVVILPSTVIAKVTATNGREMQERCLGSFFTFEAVAVGEAAGFPSQRDHRDANSVLYRRKFHVIPFR
jgi:hypothetical protein